MPRTIRRAVRLCGLGLFIVWLFVGAGCQAMRDLNEVLYPTHTPIPAASSTAALPTHAPQPTASPPPVGTATAPVVAPSSSPTRAGPTQTPPAPPPAPPTLSPQAAEGDHLVFAEGGAIYRGDYYGGDPVEIASVPELEAWDFYQGVLAIARGDQVEIIDLNQGVLQGFEVALGAEVTYSHLLWSASGEALLYAAVVEDKTATAFERSVELRALSRTDGRELGSALLHDTPGVTLLHYDEALGQALFIPLGSELSFVEVQQYDLTTGQPIGVFPTQGEGEAVISPDGRYLLVEQPDLESKSRFLLLFDLKSQGAPSPAVWRNPAETHSVSYAWSPDGRFVAFLLRDGEMSYEATQGLGVWVLDVASMEATKVIDETPLSSSLVGWTPDSSHIVGYHRGVEDGVYFYAVRPDGGDRRILTLKPEAEILGWMLPADMAVVPKVSVDPWRVRFLSTAGDPEALAQTVAQFVSEQAHADDQEVSERLGEYLLHTGLPLDIVSPRVERVTDELSLVHIPPFSIYLLGPDRAQLLANGHLIVDARLVDDELGLIFGVVGASAVQPAYGLYRRSEEGAWQLLWGPQGQRDWVAADGEISFVGEGLETLRVKGTSFGLENKVLAECHVCPHRHLTALWTRQGDLYARQTKLAADATLDDVYWEMTERTPYAVLYECLRRVRDGLPADALVASGQVLTQIRALGLLDGEARLVPEEEKPEGVRFSVADGTRHFFATIQDGRIVRIEQSGV